MVTLVRKSQQGKKKVIVSDLGHFFVNAKQKRKYFVKVGTGYLEF